MLRVRHRASVKWASRLEYSRNSAILAWNLTPRELRDSGSRRGGGEDGAHASGRVAVLRAPGVIAVVSEQPSMIDAT